MNPMRSFLCIDVLFGTSLDFVCFYVLREKGEGCVGQRPGKGADGRKLKLVATLAA